MLAEMKYNGNGNHVGKFWILGVPVSFFFRGPGQKICLPSVFYDIGASNAAFG